MKDSTNLLLTLTLWFGLLFSGTSALACSGTCASDADCSANSCRYCDTDFGRCADCCEYTEAVTCPGACAWEMGECRNATGFSCGIGVPETPRDYRNYFFVGIFAIVVGVMIWIRRRRAVSSS